MTFPQKEMIARTKEICREDLRLAGALMFGSFAIGEGDPYSDIEFCLFFNDGDLPEIDQKAWISQISPVALYFPDDFGHHTAIFANLVRGEFHFEPASNIPIIASWQGYAWFPDAASAVIVDRTGQIEKYIQPFVGGPPDRQDAATVTHVTSNFLNLMLFGVNVMARGEGVRAWMLLRDIHTQLLKLVRVWENRTDHWPSPAKGLENDISPAACARYRLCTAGADPHDLIPAYQETWQWGRALMEKIAERAHLPLPDTVIQAIAERIRAMGEKNQEHA
ncbi:nucleotidyltransferase domain-containing protein [Desulfosarcina sp. OttesenSCG-928-A07]|nr:nucleotidyltransferase domain-containing protein [Desulfosarcina sp. OttesenSCG-928-G17]MDL2330228.1 nucleotidyltransferase domain-containing protein [Desulfosarcina sp. OttesenSCG-928-A07]